MLKNAFRRLIGLSLLAVFGVAVFQYARQTTGNRYVWSALSSGIWLLAFFAVILWLAWRLDRKRRQRGE